MMDADIVHIDPRLIVNSFGVRPVTTYQVKELKDAIRRNGYVSSSLITCRLPTAQEIAAFYREAPHCLSITEAEIRAQDILKQPQSNGHFYCIDGLHRKKAILELIDEKCFQEGLRILARVVKDLGKEYEIALSISLNSSNEYCIKLSTCALVLQCNKYDEIVNSNGRKKPLSAAEVARRMVQCGGLDKHLSESTARAMAETRRQVIGISRKLPELALRYLERVQGANDNSAEAAFTISNLKAVPKILTSDEALSLMKRFRHFYKTQAPIQKPMPAKNVPTTCVYIRRAINAVNNFLKLCEFAKMPPELEYFTDQMKNTNKHDEALSDCLYDTDFLYDDLVLECEKKVTGGAAKVMIAKKKILLESRKSGRQENGGSSDDLSSHALNDVGVESIAQSSAVDKDTIQASRNSGVSNAERNHAIKSKMKGAAKTSKRKLIAISPSAVDTQKVVNDQDITVSKTYLNSEDSLNANLPPGWALFNATYKDFVKSNKEWNMVEFLRIS